MTDTVLPRRIRRHVTKMSFYLRVVRNGLFIPTSHILSITRHVILRRRADKLLFSNKQYSSEHASIAQVKDLFCMLALVPRHLRDAFPYVFHERSVVFRFCHYCTMRVFGLILPSNAQNTIFFFFLNKTTDAWLVFLTSSHCRFEEYTPWGIEHISDIGPYHVRVNEKP